MRGEKEMLDLIVGFAQRPVRDMLQLMLQWHIGIRTDFGVDSGKLGKYFKKYLEPTHWAAFVETFPDADYDHIWQSLFVMGDLFREIAVDVANHTGCQYLIQDDERVTAYLRHVRNLPPHAEGVY